MFNLLDIKLQQQYHHAPGLLKKNLENKLSLEKFAENLLFKIITISI